MNVIENSQGLLKRSSLMPVGVGEPRNLTQEDMNRHALRDPQSGPFAPLRSIRNSHHMVARMLADGESVPAISAVLGYSTDRVRILEEDPSIRELVSHYKAQADARTADIHTQIQNLTLNAMQELAERLETDPEEFTKDELLKIVTSGLDRTGHGVSSKISVTKVDVAQVISAIKSHSDSEQSRRVLTREEAEALYDSSEDQTRLIGADS